MAGAAVKQRCHVSVGRRLRALVALACLWAVAGQAAATAGPLSPASRRANFDRNCEFLTDAPLPLPDLEHYDAGLCDVPVPRQLHQIWFGPPHPVFAERMRSWESFAAAYGYSYKLWQVADLKTMALRMFMSLAKSAGPRLLSGGRRSYPRRLRSGASSPSWTYDRRHLSGLGPATAQRRQGLLRPRCAGCRCAGVTAISENEARHTGEVGTFLHQLSPLPPPAATRCIAHLVDTVAQNHHDSWCSRLRRRRRATPPGPWPLTRGLAARAVNVVPMDEGYAWHLCSATPNGPTRTPGPAGHVQNVPQPSPGCAPGRHRGARDAGCFSWLPGGSCLPASSKRIARRRRAERRWPPPSRSRARWTVTRAPSTVTTSRGKV